MKKSYLFGGIGGAVAISIAVAAYILTPTSSTVMVTQTDETFLDNMSDVLNFTYTDANTKLKEVLAVEDISMSSPVILKEKTDIDKYCTFLKDKEKQR